MVSLLRLFCCAQSDDYQPVDCPESYKSGIGVEPSSFEHEVQVREVVDDGYDRSMDYPRSLSRSLRGPSCCSLFCTCCCLTIAILAIVGLVNFVIKRSSVHVECLSNDYIDVSLPRPPTNYPEHLRGTIWMDQARSYASVSEGGDSGSLAMSFGDSTFNPETRTIEVSNTGRSWTLENTAKGYMKYFAAYFFDYRYSFTFDESFQTAQIYPGFAPLGGVLGTWSVPKILVSLTMELQDITGQSCPPPSVNWEAVRACAKWIRKSSLPLLPGLGESEYAAFEIVDPQGVRTAFYDIYVAYANNGSKPFALPAQIILGLDTTVASCDAGESSIVGA